MSVECFDVRIPREGRKDIDSIRTRRTVCPFLRDIQLNPPEWVFPAENAE
jgi:hypothetical protein